MKKRLGLLLSLLCAFGMTSCGDSGTDKGDSGTDKTDVSAQVGEACDSSTFDQTCEGNRLRHCLNHIVAIDDCATLVSEDASCVTFAKPATPETCDEEDEECISNSQSTSGQSTCKSSENQCSVENEIQVLCKKSAMGMTYLHSYRCDKANDGRLFYRHVSQEKCHDGYGVCSPDNKCLDPVPCEDGYETHCDGNILKKCKKNRLLTSDCSSYSTPRVCSVIDETPKCLSSKKECTNEGEEIVTSCNVNTGKEFISVCTRAENGKLYYESAGSRLCLSGCNEEATACKAASCTSIGETQEKCRLQGTSTTYIDTYTCTEKDGAKVLVLTSSDKCDNGHGTCSEDDQCIPAEDCETKSFESRCDDSTAVNCTSKKIRYNHCDLATTPKICAVVNDKASCFSADSDLCSAAAEGTEIVTNCIANINKTNVDKEFLKKCTKAKDGNFYYVSSGSRECPNGCNAEGTKCNQQFGIHNS